MDTYPNIEIDLFENRFWLQIMGDHSRFIFFSLAPTEAEYLLTAQEFIILFDQLLEQSQKQLSFTEVKELNLKAQEVLYRFRKFNLELLSMSLNSDLRSHLSSSIYNEMLNELDEYLLILNLLVHDQNPSLHPLHYHMLWLNDAIGHTSTLIAALDLVENDLLDRIYNYELQFHNLYLKSLTLNGYLRTQLDSYPSLERLNEQVKNAMTSFTEFLESLRDQRMDKKILGTLMPLMADHMAREEYYYLRKLSQTTRNVRMPDCDPTRPRLEA